MEKRALLAFGLILLVWVFYFSPYYQEDIMGVNPSPPNSAEPSSTPAPSGSPSDNSITEIPQVENRPTPVQNTLENWDREEKLLTLKADSSTGQREIVVEGDYYRGVIDTKGGVIRSWKLKHYEGLDSPWVELIPQPNSGGPFVRLNSEEGIIDLSQVVFESDNQDLLLNSSKSSGTISLHYSDNSGLEVIKRFIFSNADYAVSTQIELKHGNNIALGNKYALRWDGIRVTEPNREFDLLEFRAFRQVGDNIEDLDIGSEEVEGKQLTATTHWVGVRSKYFFAGIIPDNQPGVGSLLSGRPTTVDGQTGRQLAAEIEMPLTSQVRDQFLIYLGPVDYDLLAQYNKGLEGVVYLGWAIIAPISKIILIMLVWLHQFITNYGLVIIILSIIVKVVLYPLTYKSMKATQGMQQLQPKMEQLKQKYKDDAQRLNKEMMKLYREQGVNPIGGCLPMLLQMPILYSLYIIFSSTIELRRAPFGFWIEDLAQKDPYYVMPILMGLTMLIQSKMTMKDPRQAAFIYFMPVVLFIFMMDLPSGLVLYWTMVNILTIIQQFIQNRYLPTPATSS